MATVAVHSNNVNSAYVATYMATWYIYVNVTVLDVYGKMHI